MAQKNSTVYLGYEDEPITEKYRGQINHKVNKIGGNPDFPYNNIDKRILVCNLCTLPCRLVVQIYAPLENSSYNRTLYIFACINPKCWNRNESFKCIRIQNEEVFTKLDIEDNACGSKLNTIDWCSNANDWGDEEDDNNANLVEENSNILTKSYWKISDDETSSTEDSLQNGLGSLCIDDKNANNGALGGAVGRQHSPMATAEIEGNEEETVTVETPTTPKSNIKALLDESIGSSMSSNDLFANSTAVFTPYFMSVWEEDASYFKQNDSHVKELMADYQRKNCEFPMADGNVNRINEIIEKGGTEVAIEEYEKARPLHGDLLFHHFMDKMYSCPGHILRYNREGSPLLLQKIQDVKRQCRYCQDELVFELQLMPTIISNLRLQTDIKWHSRLDFGTVLIYTCKQSCWSSNECFKEEVVIVQKENY